MYPFNFPTPLHIAAEFGNLQFFKQIIAKSSNKNPPGRIRLFFYAESIPERYLISSWKYGVKNDEDYGVTPFHIAAANGNFEICSVIMKNMNVYNPRTDYGITPLLIAATNGHSDIFRLIFAMTDDKNPVDNYGITLFSRALYILWTFNPS